MIIQGVTLNGTSAYDASFNSNGALLYLDAGQAASYPSGSTWTDLSNNNNNATLTNSPTVNTGWNGDVIFNGSNQYASTPTAKYNQTYTGKTVFIVARAPSAWSGAFRCLFGTASGTRNFNTYIYNNGSAYVIHWSANGLGGFSNNLPFTPNQWFIITVTQTTGGLVSYYFNGQPVGTNVGQTFAQWASNGGENVGAGDNYWTGDIPVCAVYGRALNPSEVLQNYNALAPRYGLGIVTTGLLANYDTAGYTTGTTIADTSGNGRSLTLYNTPTATTANRSPVIAYNGSTQWAIDTAGYGTLLNTTAGFTYDTWVRPNAVVNGTVIAEWDNSTADGGWKDAQTAFVNGTINGGVFSLTSQPYVTGPSYSATTWYNVTLTYNGTNTTTLYVNGVKQGTATSVKAYPSGSVYLSLAKYDAVGAYLGGATNYFAGQAGPWKVYSQALTDAQVSQNFNALRGRYGI